MFYFSRKRQFITLLSVVLLILCLSIGITGCSKKPAASVPQAPQQTEQLSGQDPSSSAPQSANPTNDNPQDTQTSDAPFPLPELGSINIHFIDVCQADCIFIDIGDYDILIDAGNNGDGNLIIDYLKSLDTDDIEIMVATHPHEDHIGGLDDVLAAFAVETIIDSGRVHTTETYKSYLNYAEAEEGARFLLDDDMVSNIAPGIVFSIIETGDDYDNMNDVSVISMLAYGDIDILFTGDMEAEVELNTLHKFQDVDILKVGHHGSSSSSSPAFLDKVKPEVAIISCGKGNTYGHPHDETLKALSDRDVQIYRTDLVGHIILTTDGKTYKVNKGSYEYNSTAAAPTVAVPVTPPPLPVQQPSAANGKFVWSKNSDKYHYPTCASAKKIAPENLVEF